MNFLMLLTVIVLYSEEKTSLDKHTLMINVYLNVSSQKMEK